LGRGAFGEVWEGTAEDIMGPETGIHRVAVKVCYHNAQKHLDVQTISYPLSDVTKECC